MAMKEQNLADNKPVPPRSRGEHFDTHVPRDAVNRAPLGPSVQSNDRITHVNSTM